MSERYEQSSIILANNKYFIGRGELLNDTVIATALINRLLHHAHVINIRGKPTGWKIDSKPAFRQFLRRIPWL